MLGRNLKLQNYHRKKGDFSILTHKNYFCKAMVQKTRILCLYAMKGMHTESRMTDYHDMDVIRVVELMITAFFPLVFFCNFMKTFYPCFD